MNIIVNLALVILLAPLSAGAEEIASVGPQGGHQNNPVTVSILQNELAGIIKEEGRIRNQIQNDTQIALRPHTEYLLYQKSLRFPEHTANLMDIKDEKTKIVEALSSLLGEGAVVGRALTQEGISPGLPYTGMPMLAMNEARQVASLNHFEYHPFWTPIFRLLFSLIVIMMVSFPAATLFRLISESDKKCPVRVYPLLTVRRMDGHREFLPVAIRRGQS